MSYNLKRKIKQLESRSTFPYPLICSNFNFLTGMSSVFTFPLLKPCALDDVFRLFHVFCSPLLNLLCLWHILHTVMCQWISKYNFKYWTSYILSHTIWKIGPDCDFFLAQCQNTTHILGESQVWISQLDAILFGFALPIHR